MGKNSCNWRGLAVLETTLNTKFMKLNQDFTNCSNGDKKIKLELKRLTTNEDINRVNKQVQWANNFLKNRNHPHPNDSEQWTAQELTKLITDKKSSKAGVKVIITDLQAGWRQVKKGPVSTVEVTNACKDKIEKLAEKDGLHMKEYVTQLIMEQTENNKYKQKYEGVKDKISKLELNVKSYKSEENEANSKILKLIDKYKELLKDNIEMQVRYATLSENTPLPKLTQAEQNKVNEKHKIRLEKCISDFLFYEKQSSKLKFR